MTSWPHWMYTSLLARSFNHLPTWGSLRLKAWIDKDTHTHTHPYVSISFYIYIYISISLSKRTISNVYISLSMYIHTPRTRDGIGYLFSLGMGELLASDICSVWEWGNCLFSLRRDKTSCIQGDKEKEKEKEPEQEENMEKEKPLGWNWRLEPKDVWIHCGHIPILSLKVSSCPKFTPLVESVHEISAPGRSEHGELHGGPDLGPIHRPGSTSSLKT